VVSEFSAHVMSWPNLVMAWHGSLPVDDNEVFPCCLSHSFHNLHR
jgi:hypothetical protein